ncbi:MAG: hypothetical protein A3H69_03055 [Candidatus Sungbacteria bacterium RIFCSPLOWO2_02_FULL_47_9]|uniref:DNA ligase n=1 Tax=Candidatus Sungbacteria bacterium RIFCSPHIGHO2_01_FULL_47_32 TaxID=1802264 RepID=A0A1G2K330_9BACT|nr:MAG: ligase protein [Parcubacteria group bacterium GW2011_GWA2_47_10]OGZ93832.1 MAG: hypothetical protein A2633_04340 [Candidatus Sungbacteria bacterium RIFCSPHIGHO2_01_FULL_47_32]OHA04703.1 MAG: hypothetical protein A3A28_00820 [Candidatus Sungbacteria bacterium RIFCSPLOWO2_01_FULL_47_32]OHA09065.1 MAG: hypothetical protein A3H69_03055 [Candidatus Sungbacteria bacterium RIFCSPLOWO2_02_FULL_47_9]
MKKKEAEIRIKKLREEINRHRYLYHVLDRQEISDAALDSLKHELACREKEYPELITADSPTQRVGGEPLSKFKKVSHDVRMISLSDVFSEDELREWETRVKKLVSRPSNLDYFAEAKGDGFAVSLVYENGAFSIGSTRGDGITGEDVTENLKTIDAIPLAIAENVISIVEKHTELKGVLSRYPRVKRALENLPKKIEFRGEVYMSKKVFEAANKELKKKGLPEFANPRNIAAGSVRQLNPKITASRKLDFFAWDLVTDMGQETHEEEHIIMKLLGFPTVPLTRHCRGLEDIMGFWADVGKARGRLPFLIDGVVVQVNNGKIFEELGIVGKAPRGAVAFKFPAEESTSIIKSIALQVGRTGVLTPVATLEPARIGGVTVTHATLHNIDEINRLDVHIGDTVIVERAGDVIPAITGVLKRMRPKNAKKFHMPKECPICGSPVIHNEEEVAYYCSNKNCAAVEREKLCHFVSKNAFDIDGLGPKIIDALLENGLVRDAADLFTLKKEDVEVLERFAEKSASNLIEAIGAKRSTDLSRFIFALGIRHVGEETAFDFARHFGSIEKLALASREELESIRDVGGVVARSAHEWFRQKKNIALVEKFRKNGLIIKHAPKEAGGGKLSGKSIVLTGELSSLGRNEAKTKIRELGGDPSESVSKKTDYVVIGENPGSKYDKAKKLGIKIIDEKEFLRLIA